MPTIIKLIMNSFHTIYTDTFIDSSRFFTDQLKHLDRIKQVSYFFFQCLLVMILVALGCSKDLDIPNVVQEEVPEEVIPVLPHTNWQLNSGNPIMEPSLSPSNWNETFISSPMVIEFKDTLRMWFSGANGEGFESIINIGYAWSLDGLTWNQHPEPVLSPNAGKWDHPHNDSPIVLRDGDTLRMWFGGGKMNAKGMQIGYAISTDGISWEKHPDPVIQANNRPWNIDGVLPGPVLKEDHEFKMWFGGGIDQYGYPTSKTKWSTGLATSADGINWFIHDEPVLSYSTSSRDFDFSTALAGTVIKRSDSYEMWYCGSKKLSDIGFPDASIGYAISEDGIAWEKYGHNPVLKAPPDIIGKYGVAFWKPSVLVERNKYMMWFTAWHPGPTICVASVTE